MACQATWKILLMVVCLCEFECVKLRVKEKRLKEGEMTLSIFSVFGHN